MLLVADEIAIDWEGVEPLIWLFVWLICFAPFLIPGWFLTSGRSHLRHNISFKGCMWEASYRAPLSWQVRKDMLVPGWNCLEGKLLKLLRNFKCSKVYCRGLFILNKKSHILIHKILIKRTFVVAIMEQYS